MSEQQLVEYISKAVIFNDDNFLAFNKPYSLPYASAAPNSLQIDRVLQELKHRFSVKTGYLRVLKPVDKQVSGVLTLTLFEGWVNFIFRDGSVYKSIAEKYKAGLVEQHYRAILSRVPRQEEAIINVPLVKTVREQNVQMKPIQFSGRKGDALFGNTHYKVISDNGFSAYVKCIVKDDFTHQIRAHLGWGLECPILGDKKYGGRKEYWLRKLHPKIMDLLNLSGNQHHRLPLYLHLHEVVIPYRGYGTGSLFLKAPIPEFFSYTLKKLRLLVK
ncbi:unnamed protein product [Enterobius vermicularis]|uniref:Pseudouridylate synthase RPUSD4, mitochondrial n=1 Tax=Enterobius vermicularis TaxID=51028 RepID=A0A0N4V5F3_ENTVE|nr:unnamed protein product [Enterobius vermicularis]